MKLCSRIHSPRAFLGGFAAVAICFTACSSQKAQSNNTPTPVAARKERSPAETAVATASIPRSVFTVNQNSRDPFYPQAKKAAVVVASTSAEPVPLDVPSLLQANFQGVISSGGTSIAIINNVMLEPGRGAVIPIRAAGQERQIAVRCRDVSRDSVLLEVQGYAAPVRIARRLQ